MTEDASNSTEIKSFLEKTKEPGESYTPRPEVERQIEKVLTLQAKQLFELLKNRQREADGYLLDETIVYLLRARREDNFFRDNLYAELNRRIWKLLRNFYKKFDNAADFEDFGQTVEMTVIKNIFNIESGTGRYAQIYFGDFVVKTATYGWYGKLRQDKKVKEMFEIERADEDETAETDENRFVSAEISTEEKMILQARLAELPENARNAAILHFLDGWQIESKNERQPTISKLFNVSSRTIRNWLNQAREILAAQ